MIPVVLGTIVIGFVIGAGLSIAGRHGSEPVAIASPAPTVEPTLAPATLAPTEKPMREPTDEPATQQGVVQAPATHVTAAAASAAASAASAAAPAAVPATRAERTAVASPVAGASHAAAVVASPQGVAVPTSAPAAADDTDSDFGRLAAGVVRGYLAAVARGDSAAAATSLANANDSVTEAGVVDGTTRITHLEARGVGDAATVNVDFSTDNGAYSGQYTVRRSATGAAVIVAHSILKP